MEHTPQQAAAEPGSDGGFRLELSNFSGPFDLLLQLITARELDITDVALAEVTDEFISYLRALQAAAAASGTSGLKLLDETTEFLVVASTLLDLKAARLLPSGQMAEAEDFELLEARDLLFARLLQYKAFKQAAEFLDERWQAESARHPREVALEPALAALLPELVFNTGPQALAALAARALAPKAAVETSVATGHLHTAPTSIAEEAGYLADLLAGGQPVDFSELAADAASQLVVVVRFLALLEMFRQRTVEFIQAGPLQPLQVVLAADGQFDAAAIVENYGPETGGGEADHE